MVTDGLGGQVVQRAGDDVRRARLGVEAGLENVDGCGLPVDRARQPGLVLVEVGLHVRQFALAVRGSGQRQAARRVGPVLLGQGVVDDRHDDAHDRRYEHDDCQEEAGPAPGRDSQLPHRPLLICVTRPPCADRPPLRANCRQARHTCQGDIYNSTTLLPRCFGALTRGLCSALCHVYRKTWGSATRRRPADAALTIMVK